MKWLCSQCGREIDDHSLREIHGGRCTYTAPAPLAEKPTASEIGRVNREAVEDTGEQFDLGHYRFEQYPRLSEE